VDSFLDELIAARLVAGNEACTLDKHFPSIHSADLSTSASLAMPFCSQFLAIVKKKNQTSNILRKYMVFSGI
jgi:hypothetical protein